MPDMRLDSDDGAEIGSYFDSAARAFDNLYSPQGQNAFMRWINRWLRRDIAGRFLLTMKHVGTKSPRSVLDAGCGSGRYIAALAEMGVKRIVGLDLSGEMLELARAQAAGTTGARIDFVRADFADWPAGETFDLVIAMGFFDYVNDPKTVLEKMRKISRGSVIASFPSRHWFRTPLRKFRYKLKKCPVYFYSAEQIERLAHDAGFACINLTKIRGAGMDYVATFWYTG